jgi:hypothetical protein
MYDGEYNNEPPDWYPASDDEQLRLAPPEGYRSVEHDDGTVHAVDLDDLTADVQDARTAPVCGRATGPSSDEAGRQSWLELADITCWECIAILS